MQSRLMTSYPTGATTAWTTTRDIAEVRTMMTDAYNSSKGVLAEERENRTRDAWSTLNMLDWSNYDVFVRIFRERLDEYEAILGVMTEDKRCHSFLSKLNQHYSTIRSTYFAGQSTKEGQIRRGVAPTVGIGYPDSLNTLITDVQAAIEGSGVARATRHRDRPFATLNVLQLAYD